jgi:hypothetical protein
MGLSYNEMYDISAGIYFAFKNNVSKRILSVSHKQKKREDVQKYFPESKYRDWTRENFIVACLYINYNNSPSSFTKAVGLLQELDKKDVFKFKDEIIYYRKYLDEDLLYIENNLDKITLDGIIKLYKSNKIKWYTFYFYLLAANININELKKSRINGYLYKKIEKLLLYITFSEKSILKVKREIVNKINI